MNAREQRSVFDFRWVAIALAVLAAVGVSTVRAPLDARFRAATTNHDVYTLPDPEKTIVASLGWRSALADYLYANVLVSYGIHIQEKRRFEFVGNYLDTVNALDPKFRTPYRYTDTLLVLSAVKPLESDYDRAREIFERGMKDNPDDSELWNTAGQFIAYLAPPNFSNEAKKKAWRLEGARRLARACELVGSNENVPYHCITAAGLFTSAGEREATVQFLRRLLAVSDNEEIRALASGYLSKVIGEKEGDDATWRLQRFSQVWEKDLPFVSKDAELILGPPVDPARCAGVPARYRFDCSPTWRAWGERLERR